MKLTYRNIKIIIVLVIVIAVVETCFIIKKNYGTKTKEENTQSSTLDDISEEDIENLLNRKLLITPLSNDFKLITPENKNIKTGENYITFMGMSDPNEVLKVNDDEVDVYYTGNFIFKYPLKFGDNKVTFTLGDKTLEYNINRVNGIIDYITPGETLKVEKNMKAEISAKIYSGSKAYAVVDNRKVELTQVQNDEELSAKGTCYADFKGYIDTSQYEEGKSLGKVTVYASLDNEETSKEGPEFFINNIENKTRMAVINKDSSFVYDSKTTSAVPLNDVYPLAKGTKDYITSEIIADKKVYYNLASGMRIKAEDIEISPLESLDNIVNSLEVNEDSDYAYVTIDRNSKAPYKFITENIKYKDRLKEDYSIEKFSLNEVKIYLDYAVSIKNNLSYLNNSFFESVTYEEDTKGKYLLLKFKSSSSYNGHFAYYDSEGKLVFKFLKKQNSINNMTIVIDPGHGLVGKDKLDIGFYGFNDINENIINMKIAKKVYNMLNEEGAHCYILYTDSEAYPLSERGAKARENNADLYISLHCNSETSGKLNGVETYYFTPYSKVFADNINNSLVKCYKNELFEGEKGNYDRGAKYNSNRVILERENPSVLIETGFIENPTFFNKLIDETMQIKIAKYIVKGIKDSIE